MKFIYTKDEFLKSTIIEGLKTKEKYEKDITKYNQSIIQVEVEDGFPTYEEYLDYYSKESINFCNLFIEQTKKISNFQIWLLENKNKTFTYDEIEAKLCEQGLSANGFNGGK